MTPKERSKWFFLTGFRSLLALLDLAGILVIGFVVSSTAIFLTSGSDPERVFEIFGLTIPAVTARSLPWVSAAVLALFLTKAVLSIILTKKAAFFVATVEARSAKTIAEVNFGSDLGEARKRSREEVMFAIQVGSPHAFNVLLNALNTLVTETALFFLICIGFFLVDPVATFAAVIYFGLIAFIMQHFVGSLMSRAGKLTAEGTVQANTAISDLLSVFRELLVLGKREKYINDIYKAHVSTANSSATQYYLSGMPRYIIEAALLLGVALFFLGQAFAGDILKSATTIGVFLSGGFRLTAALLPLQNSLLTINGALASAKTAHEILHLAKGLEFGSKSLATSNSRNDDIANDHHDISPLGVRLNSVSFAYPDSNQPTLIDITFEISPGTQVALMGPSGSGKSTIADLVCTVIIPTSGSISLFNTAGDLSALETKGRLSYVPQRPGLVSGTILDNLALAEKTELADRNRALEVLELTGLRNLISGLPEGLDTPLGKLQDGLSGGQIQRIGLARALYTHPSLLVMDEATSALDAESEAEIQRALDSMKGKVTVVLIAHRINTIQHADKVFLVKDGRLKDSGTFRELVARNPSVERVVDLMRVEKN